MPRGGRRPNAGRKKKSTTPSERPSAPSTPAASVPETSERTVKRLDPKDITTLDLQTQFGLTRREFLFVQVLLTEPGIKQGDAYQQAGYRAKSGDDASTLASRLIGRDRVARALAAGRALIAERNVVTQDRVLRELARLGFNDPRRVFNKDTYTLLMPTEFDDDTAAAIAGIEVVTRAVGEGEVEYIHKIKFTDKVGPLGLMARHLGMLHDKASVGDKRFAEVDAQADDSELIARLEGLLAKAKQPAETEQLPRMR
jgi:phage terminase small subunit